MRVSTIINTHAGLCPPCECQSIPTVSPPEIYGSTEQGRPTFIKSDLLDDPSKYPGLFSVKDIDEHRAARRTFQPAFNPRLYSEYAPTIDKFVSVWLDKLEKLSASEGGVDVTHVRDLDAIWILE